jgi:hypothetical protein
MLDPFKAVLRLSKLYKSLLCAVAASTQSAIVILVSSATSFVIVLVYKLKVATTIVSQTTY